MWFFFNRHKYRERFSSEKAATITQWVLSIRVWQELDKGKGEADKLVLLQDLYQHVQALGSVPDRQDRQVYWEVFQLFPPLSTLWWKERHCRGVTAEPVPHMQLSESMMRNGTIHWHSKGNDIKTPQKFHRNTKWNSEHLEMVAMLDIGQNVPCILGNYN